MRVDRGRLAPRLRRRTDGRFGLGRGRRSRTTRPAWWRLGLPPAVVTQCVARWRRSKLPPRQYRLSRRHQRFSGLMDLQLFKTLWGHTGTMDEAIAAARIHGFAGLEGQAPATALL